MTEPTPKQIKAAAIHQAALAIADYYNVTAESLFSKDMDRKNAARNARGALMAYLRAAGMSYESIGRIVNRSSDSVRVNSRNAGLDPSMQPLLASLPVIPNTINLTPTP